MFPFDLDDEEDVVIEDTDEAEPSDYEIDFSTGKLTGKIIKGLDAVIQWIRLVLGTDRYYFEQYSWNYGSELGDLIGNAFTQEYLENEVKRMIADALSTNPYIQSIDNVQCEVSNDDLTASFTVNTIFGNGEVTFNV